MSGGVIRVMRTTGKLIWNIITSTARHDIASLAAVISFYVFFSLFPLILLAIYVVSIFMPHVHIDLQSFLIEVIRPYFPALKEANQFIEENIAHLAEVGGRVGLLSAATLTWSATSGFIAVQQSMDVILDTHTSQQRSYVSRRLIAFLMLFVLLLLTLASALILVIYSSIKGFILTHPALAWLTWAQGLSRVMFPLSLFLGFAVSYRYLPSRKTRWTALLPGAFLATIGLDVGRHMFVWYASHLVHYQMIYGTLTAVMLLVLWMYIGSMVMLFGVEVSAAIELLLQSDSPKY